MMSRISGFGRCIAMAAALVVAMPGMSAADSLRQAMADAYRNSQLLEQSRYLLRVEDEGVNQAFAALLPTVSFVASSSRDLVQDTSTTTFRLLGELVIYQGGARINARRGAEQAVNAARQQLISLEQQVLIDAVTAYLEVWEAIQIVEVRQRNVRVLTEQLRAARDRFEVGEDTRTDVAQAESQLATARSALAAAEGTLEIARELFNLAVGRYPNALASPGGLPHLPSSEDEAQRLARQQHPAVLARQFEVAAAEFGVGEARGASRPNITLDLSLGQTVEAPNPTQEGESATLALTLTQPIYRGGQLGSLERQALAQVEAVRYGLNQQVRLNLQVVGNAYARLRIANAQIQASDQRIRAAQLAFEGVREEAALGARTTLDVLDAEQDLLEARISRIEAQGDLYAASYGILAASGLMTVRHLELPVPEYDVAAYGAAFPGGRVRVASPQGDRLDTLLQAIGRE
ncbi:TolC family outer membrane protein [Roseicyclus mahoneyensis]|uniref:Outer membrane protein n=1 Tax=Roseicyclus mahoneyensis TaxID=164332 RepID=A0A316G4R1_9RHOB|nr:TolC family outer membrane protein [Roseicyclus mahoneyensis]PWK55315.1 outer membrane protein [Roseicyclus mahoneyensis]